VLVALSRELALLDLATTGTLVVNAAGFLELRLALSASRA
jgi:hypothetical protein